MPLLSGKEKRCRRMLIKPTSKARGRRMIAMRVTARRTDLALPATKSNAVVYGRFDASELHPDPVDASPNDLRRAPNSGEGVLKIEGARQPALPAKRQLCAASRYVADATRQRTALRHEHLCGSIDGAALVSSSLHFALACAKVLNKPFTCPSGVGAGARGHVQSVPWEGKYYCPPAAA